mmetsp:Transcript_311/g.654  ORF Transcript_311/g.654 Transcript_311/m.654 type:complete len:85 (+) Transcript_311:1-255(+)
MFIRSCMEKFDKDHNHELDLDEMVLLLTSLNDGQPVQHWEVYFVVDQADVSNTGTILEDELFNAISLWYRIDRGEGKCCGCMIV